MVFHVDMDAFYAAVEQRDDPSLRGKPVIVGGLGSRGVVSTASYEARKYGVHSAMPMFQARRRCPHGVYRAPRMRVYAETSKALRSILDRYSPQIEPLSLDEAFLEMTGTENLLGPPAQVAAKLLDDIERELKLTASIGVAPQKFIAKMASDLRKPRGLTVVVPGQERMFLAPLPIEKLWGVGPKANAQLRAAGLRCIGDIARCDRSWLQKRFGESFGAHIYELSHGRDERPVVSARQRKSVGVERTLETDIRGPEAAQGKIMPLCDELGRLLRQKGQQAHGLRVKLKFSDFSTMTRQMRLRTATDTSAELRRVSVVLLREFPWEKPVRLLGVSAILEAQGGTALQHELFAPPHRPNKESQLDRMLDRLDAKFGKGVVRRADSELPDEMTPGLTQPRDG